VYTELLVNWFRHSPMLLTAPPCQAQLSKIPKRASCGSTRIQGQIDDIDGVIVIGYAGPGKGQFVEIGVISPIGWNIS